jgi:thioredoxin reductase (NADPH)
MANPDIYDVCIIGGGPAGHSASVYTSRAMLKTILFEGLDNPGGQLTQTTSVENYLGFPNGINGPELCDRFREQSIFWNTKVMSEYVDKITKSDKYYNVYYDDMNLYIIAKSIIICSGSSAKLLTFEGSNTFWNKGITACAVCHGSLPIFRDKPLFVIGGGDTAMEDALYLSRYSANVTIVHRRDTFRASGIMQQRVFNNKNINILWNSEIIKAEGNEFLEKVSIMNNVTKKVSNYDANGVFYAIGHKPSVFFLNNSDIDIKLDEDGYIMTSENGTETTCKGIFCAGDVRYYDKKFKQAIVAAGRGCQAALEVIEYLGINL